MQPGICWQWHWENKHHKITTLKKLFLLPELLLLLGILIWSVLLGNSGADIHLHDTYYVIGGYAGQLVFLPFYLMLFLSWIMHRLLKRKGLLPRTWQWAQVGITMICLLVFPFSLSNTLPGMPRPYYDYSTFNSIRVYYLVSALSLVIFILCQLSFWIAAAILLAKSNSPR
jgi:heme/copper-type cytochrome/quinol oxidase subunit 1